MRESLSQVGILKHMALAHEDEETKVQSLEVPACGNPECADYQYTHGFHMHWPGQNHWALAYFLNYMGGGSDNLFYSTW